MIQEQKKWYTDGQTVKDKANISYNKYSQSTLEKANYDQQKTWNWQWEVNELYSPISNFENKPYAITAAKQLDELTRCIDIFSSKIAGGLKNMYARFSLKHNNEIIDALLNGSAKEGESVWQATSRQMAKDPKLALQTIWELASIIDSSDAMRTFDAMMYEKELKDEIVDAGKYELDSGYKKLYDQDKQKTEEKEENRYPDWDDLPSHAKDKYKFYKHNKAKTGITVSMQEALELRQKYFETILMQQGATTFFYDFLQQLASIAEDAESMFYDPQNNSLALIDESIKRLVLYGNCTKITEYNAEEDIISSFVAQQDTVSWLCDKTLKITDIFIKYNMTLLQAKDYFNENEFDLICRAYNVNQQTLTKPQEMATQQIRLVQQIKKSYCEYKPHLTVWVVDTTNKEKNYPVIREGEFQNLPVQICRLNIDPLTGYGTGHCLKIIRKLRNLNQLRIDRNVALSRGINPPVAINAEVARHFGDLTPGKVKAIGSEFFREPMVSPITAQLDANILKISGENEQMLLNDVARHFFIDVLDNYETQDVHSSAGSNAIIAAAQRALQHIAPFYDVVEPFVTEIAGYFVKAVASRYDNVAVPNNQKMSSMLNVRLVGLNEKAAKDVANQESLQLFGQLMQVAQSMAPIDPSVAVKIIDPFNLDKFTRKLFYKTPEAMRNPEEVLQIQQQRAEQQQQAMAQEQQNQMALTGAQVREKNAKADQLMAQTTNLQSGG